MEEVDPYLRNLILKGEDKMGDQECNALAALSYEPKLREQLTSKKKAVEDELAKVNRAIQILDANPQMEEFLDVTAAALGRRRF